MEFKIYCANKHELIKGCVKGERNAQKHVYELYSSKMYTLCLRYVKDSMQAEDILVTAFTRVFEKISQFKHEGSFEGWIRRIVINEALAHLRKSRSMYLQTELEEAHQEPDYGQLSDHLEAEDLLTMIGELPAGYRIVFNMYALDGYTHKEIADHLGISENTSKSQLSRARTYLQKILAAENKHPVQNTNDHETATR